MLKFKKCQFPKSPSYTVYDGGDPIGEIFFSEKFEKPYFSPERTNFYSEELLEIAQKMKEFKKEVERD